METLPFHPVASIQQQTKKGGFPLFFLNSAICNVGECIEMSPLIIIPVSMLWINNGKKRLGELWTKEQDGYKGGRRA